MGIRSRSGGRFPGSCTCVYESEDAHLTQQDIQNVSFDLSKGGYDITQVDAALSRLEQAVVDKQTTREITEHGRVAWKGPDRRAVPSGM